MEAIVVKREFATREIFQNSEFEQYCVFGPEVYPLSEIQKDVNIFHNVGGWGWNDMAFYIRFSRKEFIVLIELPRYIPIEKVEKLCGPNLVIRFSTEGVFVVEVSD